MLRRLYLHQFRNHERVEYGFTPGVNWITGRNGQGKTNILEAIALLSTGRSFRTANLSQLIQHGRAYFYIEAMIDRCGVTEQIKISYDGSSKKVQYNATTYAHFTPLIGLLPSVLYAPEDIALVSGAPAHRRRLLNLHLAQIDPLYVHHFARFHKALRQRNTLLKKKREETIASWEKIMAQSGFYLVKKRKALIEILQPSIAAELKEISGGNEMIQVAYLCSLAASKAEEMEHHWASTRNREFHIGATLHGPHRDDITINLDGASAKAFASEGQKHSIVAAMRLAQGIQLKKTSELPPLLCVDDFGTHLDKDRQELFQERTRPFKQLFFTSPTIHPSSFPDGDIHEVAVRDSIRSGV